VDKIDKRNQNREAILRTLHFEGALQRSELSDRLRIRKSSVTSIAAELLAAGLVAEEQPGRARSPLRLDTARHHVVAGRVTTGAIHVARVFLDGTIRDERSAPLRRDTSPRRVLDLLASEFGRLLRTSGGRAVGAGAAVPGLLDPADGRVRYAANLVGWRDVAAGAELARRLGRPVHVDNDVRSQLWASAWFGRLLRESSNLLYVAVTDGVACALIVHGLRVLGGRHAAGEIGHVRAGHDGRVCACGKTDCLEAYCSLPAIREEVRRLRKGRAAPDDAASLARQAAHDPVVHNVLDRAAGRIARALAPLLAAVDPEAVVLGSGARELSETMRPLLEHALRTELALPASQGPRFRVGEPEGAATLKGIAGLVIEKAFRSGSVVHPARRRS
jgi:predicted NBD/HSP70 family sugar kinase